MKRYIVPIILCVLLCSMFAVPQVSDYQECECSKLLVDNGTVEARLEIQGTCAMDACIKSTDGTFAFYSIAADDSDLDQASMWYNGPSGLYINKNSPAPVEVLTVVDAIVSQSVTTDLTGQACGEQGEMRLYDPPPAGAAGGEQIIFACLAGEGGSLTYRPFANGGAF